MDPTACGPFTEGLVPADALAPYVDQFLDTAEGLQRRRFEVFEGPAIDARLLTDDQVAALRFVTFIEDHIPGYLADYLGGFPLDASVPEEAFTHNRELYRFLVRWAYEEEAHAHALSLYQVRAGLTTWPELRSTLAKEGAKPFSGGLTSPVQVFTYTLIQEKATQLFYQRFARVVQEPVLRRLLLDLSRDEARHFSFINQALEIYLVHLGPAALADVEHVLTHFRMPLADTLANYWRWSIRISDAVGFDHTEAYEAVGRAVRRAFDGAAGARTLALIDRIRGARPRPQPAAPPSPSIASHPPEPT